MHHKDIKIPSYAGYLTVNKTYNSNIFFWYVPAKTNAKNAPVVLWVQSVAATFGLFRENGPYFLSSKQKLKRNKFSWHINHHMVYIDTPIGMGYSFTDSDDGYSRNEVDIGDNLLKALQQYFLLFPELQDHKFFVVGESYGGKEPLPLFFDSVETK